jgi:sarcosine oxidase subunit gamma
MSDVLGTVITPTAPRSAAGIAAFRDQAALRAALQTNFGVAPPTTPSFVQIGTVTLSCLAPTRYYVTGPRDAGLPGLLAKSLSGLAAITDQSDLLTSFTLTGPETRETLARIVPVDLTPAKFPIGALALTRAGHLDVRLWRMAELTYELAVTRSCANDLRHALGIGDGLRRAAHPTTP